MSRFSIRQFEISNSGTELASEGQGFRGPAAGSSRSPPTPLPPSLSPPPSTAPARCLCLFPSTFASAPALSLSLHSARPRPTRCCSLCPSQADVPPIGLIGRVGWQNHAMQTAGARLATVQCLASVTFGVRLVPSSPAADCSCWTRLLVRSWGRGLEMIPAGCIYCAQASAQPRALPTP